jgi:hypothetical protein
LRAAALGADLQQQYLGLSNIDVGEAEEGGAGMIAMAGAASTFGISAALLLFVIREGLTDVELGRVYDLSLADPLKREELGVFHPNLKL